MTYKLFKFFILSLMLGTMLSSCETKDMDKFYPMNYNLIDNSNVESIDVNIVKGNNNSDNVNITARGNGGTVKIEAVSRGLLCSSNISNYIKFYVKDNDEFNEGRTDFSYYSNEWMEIKNDKTTINITFPQNISLSDTQTIEFYVSGGLTHPSLMKITRIP